MRHLKRPHSFHDQDHQNVAAESRIGKKPEPARVPRREQAGAHSRAAHLPPHAPPPTGGPPARISALRSNPVTQNIRSCTRERPSQLPGLARRLGGYLRTTADLADLAELGAEDQFLFVAEQRKPLPQSTGMSSPLIGMSGDSGRSSSLRRMIMT